MQIYIKWSTIRYHKINNLGDSILLTISFWSSLIWVLLFSLAALLSAISCRNLDFSSSDLAFPCLQVSRSSVRARWLSWSSCALLELHEIAHEISYTSTDEIFVTKSNLLMKKSWKCKLLTNLWEPFEVLGRWLLVLSFLSLKRNIELIQWS